MGRGGSSLDVLAWSVCVCERFSEYSESKAVFVIMTSMFLYGVVQPGASAGPLTGDLVCVSLQ